MRASRIATDDGSLAALWSAPMAELTFVQEKEDAKERE